MEEHTATRVQALYRGHRTRTRVWQEPKAAYLALAARIDAECGFGSPTSSSLGPSPPDHVLLRLNAGQQAAAGHGTFCPTGAGEAHAVGEKAEKTCMSASFAEPDKRTCQAPPPATTSTRSIPPIPPAPAHRRREDILVELQWANASLRERLRVKKEVGMEDGRGGGWMVEVK